MCASVSPAGTNSAQPLGAPRDLLLAPLIFRDSSESVPHNHADLVSSIDSRNHVVEHFGAKLLDDISPERRAVAVHLIKPLA
jgi:hypothetical protein